MLVLAFAALAWRVHSFGRRSPPSLGQSPAIVVLGARVFPDGTPSLALVARVEHAMRLHRRVGGLLLLSGGGGEAKVALELARASGLAEEGALLDERSRSTFDNARFSVDLLRARGVDEVVVVTDDFHSYRAVAHFRRAGLRVINAPVRRPLSRWSRLAWTLREVLAVLRRPWLLH